MPVLLGALATWGRSLIQMAVTLGLISLADKLLFAPLQSFVARVSTEFGVGEETAKDIVANELIDAALAVGVGAAVLRTRIPVRVADYLGFTSRGTGKRKLPPQAEAKLQQARGGAVNQASGGAEGLATVLAQSAKTRSVRADKLLSYAQITTAFVGLPVGIAFVIGNAIDWAAWDGSAYQGTFQRFFSLFGLEPDRPTFTPRTVSNEVYQKVYTAMKNEGAVTIRNPYTEETQSFTQENFASLVDRLASTIFIESGSVSAKQLLGAVLPLVEFSKSRTGASVSGVSTAGTVLPGSVAPSPVQIKVYTGVVAGGSLGVPREYTVRQDDMIQSVEELKAAAKNNLAAFVESLPGRFYYEIGIQNTVKTRTGFTQKGEPVQVISSYTSTGKPRYKTVYHKFAVMKVGVTDENGRSVKLATITLGPVNAVDFQPTRAEIEGVQSSITPELFTSDISDVTGIANPSPAAQNTPSVSTDPQNRAKTAPLGVHPLVMLGQPFVGTLGGRPVYGSGDSYFSTGDGQPYRSFGGHPSSFSPQFGEWLPMVSLPGSSGASSSSSPSPQSSAPTPSSITPQSTPVPVAPVSSGSQGVMHPQSALNASTLFEFYTALGKSLPSLSERAVIYARAGLGAQSTYAGTAEQNTRLLAWLKANP